LKLSLLLQEVGVKPKNDFEISSISANSKEIRMGSLYIAVKGTTHDGHSFLEDAIKSGARVCIGEAPCPAALTQDQYIQVKDSREALGLIASAFYGHPTRKLKVYGVTGTSGKTTTAFLMESVLKARGDRVGLIGTVVFRFAGKEIPATHTTPGAVELQKIFYDMQQAGCDSVVMEVSSHALDQKRTLGVVFDGAIFTNLSPEHLDYHKTMDEYFKSKKILFTDYADSAKKHGKKFVAAVNEDDAYGEKLLKELGSKAHPFNTAGMNVGLNGIQGSVNGVAIQSSLLGQFNASNIAGVVSLFHFAGVSGAVISKGIEALQGVPGRMEKIENTKGLHVIVDYAHKPDALEKVLQTLSKIKTGRIITVFGCGGDRDTAKRPVMGKISESLSDLTFVTSDNPRTEDPQKIIDAILSGITDPSKVRVEPDRKLAIQEAIKEAKAGDIVLIAGKGHEDYQILGSQKVHFDDREEARAALTES